MVDFPAGKYGTVVIDPPWNLKMVGKFGRRPNRAQELPYETMSLDEIRNLPINSICKPGAHVYLWTTNRFLHEAFHLFEEWGINFYQVLVWVKPSGAAPQGYVFGTEFCLLGFYGKPMIPFNNIGELNWFKHLNGHGEHSKKPAAFYHKVIKMSPEPRIDLFNRRPIATFDTWGYESGNELQPALQEWMQ